MRNKLAQFPFCCFVLNSLFFFKLPSKRTMSARNAKIFLLTVLYATKREFLGESFESTTIQLLENMKDLKQFALSSPWAAHPEKYKKYKNKKGLQYLYIRLSSLVERERKKWRLHKSDFNALRYDKL